ncbi:MAG: hypothetical protein JST20_12555 [Bacteroidetes bacterium]|nr:hypothetical protein [Bacteroidota bacterium]
MSNNSIMLAMNIVQKRLRCLPIVTMLLLFPSILLAGSFPQSNFAIIDSLSKAAAHSITTFLRIQAVDTCDVSISPHSAEFVILQNIISSKDITFTKENPTSKNKIELQIQDCAVRYFLYNESSDSLIREGQISAKGILNKSGVLMEIPQFTAVIRDTIAQNDVKFIEIPQYSFTKAPIPEKPKGFFTEVAEPLLFITAAAVTVLLLFTVRSQ